MKRAHHGTASPKSLPDDPDSSFPARLGTGAAGLWPARQFTSAGKRYYGQVDRSVVVEF
ncbi:MAG TPA: hypothetical protein VE422_29120 [Terriglobia bacterium]|nr:hypothetical protein [Terriglobia bacterium]